MRAAKRLLRFLSLAILMLTGCPAVGPLDTGGYGGLNDDVIGEVQFVDTRNRELEIRSDAGRRSLLRFDDKTQVLTPSDSDMSRAERAKPAKGRISLKLFG